MLPDGGGMTRKASKPRKEASARSRGPRREEGGA